MTKNQPETKKLSINSKNIQVHQITEVTPEHYNGIHFPLLNIYLKQCRVFYMRWKECLRCEKISEDKPFHCNR